MKLQMDKRFKKNVAGRFGKFSFEVGVLEDEPHMLPKRGKRGLKGKDVLSSYAGGPIRQQSNVESGLMISEVSEALRDHLGFNYLTKPFKDKSSQILQFTKEFFKLAFGRSQKKRLENLLQAIVRNPMLRGDYGKNSKLTMAIKGFDRITIDTAQLFRAIKAEVKVRSRV